MHFSSKRTVNRTAIMLSLVLLISVLALGCEYLETEEKDELTTFPTARTVINQADELGMDPHQYLDNLRKRKLAAKYEGLIDRAPETRKRKHEIRWDADKELLEHNYERVSDRVEELAK